MKNLESYTDHYQFIQHTKVNNNTNKYQNNDYIFEILPTRRYIRAK